MRIILIVLAVLSVTGCYESKGGGTGSDGGTPLPLPGSCEATTIDLSGDPRCVMIPMPAGSMSCGGASVGAARVFIAHPYGGRTSVGVAYDGPHSIGIARADDCSTCPGFAGGGTGGGVGISTVTVPAEGASFLVTMDPPGAGTIIACSGMLMPGPGMMGTP